MSASTPLDATTITLRLDDVAHLLFVMDEFAETEIESGYDIDENYDWAAEHPHEARRLRRRLEAAKNRIYDKTRTAARGAS